MLTILSSFQLSIFMIRLTKNLRYTVCKTKTVLADLTRHVLTRKENELLELLRRRGPYFALQITNVCHMVGMQHSQIVKNAVEMLSQCRGETFLQSQFALIDDFLSQNYPQQYSQIKKCQIPEKKIIDLPAGGSLTLLSDTSDYQPEEAYDKLLLDLRSQFQYKEDAVDYSDLKILSHRIQKQDLVKYLKSSFNEELIHYINNKMYTCQPNQLPIEIKVFEKIRAYLKNSPSTPTIINCLPPLTFDPLLSTNLPLQKWQSHLEMIPYYTMFSIWHEMKKQKIVGCCLNQPLNVQFRPSYFTRMFQLTENDDQISFQQMTLLKCVFHETELDKNTLVILNEVNYNFLTSMLRNVKWLEEKDRYRDFSFQKYVLDQIIKFGEEFSDINVEDMKEVIEKASIIELSTQVSNILAHQTISQNEELQKYHENIMDSLGKKKSLQNICEQIFYSEVKNVQIDKCPLISFSLGSASSQIQPIGEPVKKDSVFQEIQHHAFKQ